MLENDGHIRMYAKDDIEQIFSPQFRNIQVTYSGKRFRYPVFGSFLATNIIFRGFRK